MMKTYPCCEKACFLLTSEVMAAIYLKKEGLSDLSEDLRETIRKKGITAVVTDKKQWNCVYDEIIDEQDGEQVVKDLLQNADIGCVTLSEFEGSAETIESDDLPEEEKVSIDSSDDTVSYILTGNSCSLFHQAYKNVKEIEQEFRRRLKDFLPDDFPIRKYIVELTGTYVC